MTGEVKARIYTNRFVKELALNERQPVNSRTWYGLYRIIAKHLRTRSARVRRLLPKDRIVIRDEDDLFTNYLAKLAGMRREDL